MGSFPPASTRAGSGPLDDPADTESEDELRAELQLTWCTSRRDLPGIRVVGGGTVGGGDKDRRVRQSVVHPVEQIEHLGSQLKVRATSQTDVLADREIHGQKAGATQRIATDPGAQRPGRRQREERWIEVAGNAAACRVETSASHSVFEGAARREVRTLRAASLQAGLIETDERSKWRAADSAHDRRQLPARHERVRRERQLIDRTCPQIVRAIDLARTEVVLLIVRVRRRSAPFEQRVT